jgi:hypothetical protein
MSNSTFFISADLAQINDYTAITVIERVYTNNKKSSYFGDIRDYHLRHIERPERGTTYPKIVERLKELVCSQQLKGKDKAVVIDITGVGRPVWDLMQNNGFRNSINGITITGGNSVMRDGCFYNVPKRDLISALQVAFQNGTLKIAAGLPESDTLVKELTNFKVKININGHDQYEAWREGIHDDIVLSAAMGMWLATQRSCRLCRL